MAVSFSSDIIKIENKNLPVLTDNNLYENSGKPEVHFLSLLWANLGKISGLPMAVIQ
jgi:hypothetical protein